MIGEGKKNQGESKAGEDSLAQSVTNRLVLPRDLRYEAQMNESVPSIVLEMSPLPRLVWNQFNWTGTVSLPSWEGYQDRSGPYTSGEPNALTSCVFSIDFDHPQTQEPMPTLLPSAAQIASYKYLIANDEKLRKLASKSIFKYIIDNQYDEEEYFGGPFSLKKPDDLRNYMGLGNIHISDECFEGFSIFGFELGCAWECEHGAGVLFYKDYVIDVGQADTSFCGVRPELVDGLNAAIRKMTASTTPAKKKPGKRGA